MKQVSIEVFDRLFLEDGTNAGVVNMMMSDTIQVTGNQIGLRATVLNKTGTFAAGWPRFLLLGSQDTRSWRSASTVLTVAAFGSAEGFTASWDYPFMKVQVAVQASSGLVQLLCEVFVSMSEQ